jgi:hypothetical protein
VSNQSAVQGDAAAGKVCDIDFDRFCADLFSCDVFTDISNHLW